MKKIFLPILIVTLLCGWAFAGLTVDKNVDLANKRAAGQLELSKQSDVGARVTRVAPAADALISVSEDVTPVSNGKIRFNNANYVLKNTVPTAATVKPVRSKPAVKEKELLALYLIGINRARLERAAKDRQLTLNIVGNLNEASLLVTSKSY